MCKQTCRYIHGLDFILHGKLYITWIRASYTWQYVKRTENIPRKREEWCAPPQKRPAWEFHGTRRGGAAV